MDIPRHTHVCIVGAGPVGLTLANELKRYNIPFELIERRTERTQTSKAFAIHARSLESFRRMGVADQLLRRGIAVSGMSAYAGKRCVLGGDLSLVESEFPYVLSIPQADTEAVLLEHLQDQGKAPHWGHSVSAISQSEDLVKVNLLDSDDQLKTLSCRWLVGCDGAHSAVRSMLDIDWSGDDYDFEFLVADGRIQWAGDNTKGHTFLDRQGYVMLFPLPNGRHRVVINVDVGRYSQAELSEGLINEILQQRGLTNIHFEDPFWLSQTRGRRRIAQSFKHARVLLAGDAAHIHSPLGGQGLNTGIQDAYQLAWRLAQLKNHDSSEHPLLTSYSDERIKIATEVLENTDKLTRLFTTRSPLKVALRNWFMPSLAKQPKFANKLAATATGVGIRLNNSKDFTGTRLAYGKLQKINSSAKYIPNNLFALNGYELVLLIPEEFSAENYQAKLCAASIHFNKLTEKYEGFSGISVVCSQAALASVGAWPEYLRERVFCDIGGGFISHYNERVPHYLIVRPDGYLAAAGPIDRSSSVLNQVAILFNQQAEFVPMTNSTEAPIQHPVQTMVEA